MFLSVHGTLTVRIWHGYGTDMSESALKRFLQKFLFVALLKCFDFSLRLKFARHFVNAFQCIKIPRIIMLRCTRIQYKFDLCTQIFSLRYMCLTVLLWIAFS